MNLDINCVFVTTYLQIKIFMGCIYAQLVTRHSWYVCHKFRYDLIFLFGWTVVHLSINGLGQERCNAIANTLELRLSCTNPSIWSIGVAIKQTKWSLKCLIIVTGIHTPRMMCFILKQGHRLLIMFTLPQYTTQAGAKPSNSPFQYNIMTIVRYGDSCYMDKTIGILSYLLNVNLYAGKKL